MNLSVIFDSVEDYVNLGSLYPTNFYIRLSSRLAKLLTGSSKNSNRSITFDVLGNSCTLSTSPYSLTVNGFSIKSSATTGFKFLSEALQSLVSAELSGKVTINRPNGSSLYTDRRQFNLSEAGEKIAKGTIFPALYNQVKYSSNQKNYAITQDVNKAVVFSEASFSIACQRKSFKPSQYSHFSNGSVSFYYKSIYKVYDLTSTSFIKPSGEPLTRINNRRFLSICSAPSTRSMDFSFWTNTPVLSSLLDSSYFILVYNNVVVWFTTSVRDKDNLIIE